MSKLHPSWNDIVFNAIHSMDQEYIQSILFEHNIIPKKENILNAFTIPLTKVKFILLGESPYPRVESANGYAFWDAKVKSLWSINGLSKEVNRATSLRNFIKMLLIASGKLDQKDQSQNSISKIEKNFLINDLSELFNNLLENGFLLLNASLVLSNKSVQSDAKYWRPFIEHIISSIYEYNSSVKLLLFGRIAKEILKIQLPNINRLCSEHPFNLSFTTNSEILDFFRPINLLEKQHA